MVGKGGAGLYCAGSRRRARDGGRVIVRKRAVETFVLMRMSELVRFYWSLFI